MAWSEISLEDLDELTNELQITNKREANRNDANTKRDTRPSVKGTGIEEGAEDEDEWDEPTAKVQAKSEDETDDEVEQNEDEVELEDEEDDEGEVAKRSGNERPKSDRNVGGDKSNESETVRRALAEAQRERDELLRQLGEAQTAQHSLRKTSLESQRDSLAGEIKTLKAQVRQAKENGDHDAETDLLLAIQKKQLRELAIESALEDVAEEPKKPAAKPAQTATAPIMPPEAQKFVQRNAWIATAPEAVRMTVVAQSQMMIDKGMDPNSAEFYTALANRLSKVLDGYEVKGGDTPARPQKNEAPQKKRGSPLPPKEQTTKVYRDANGNTKVVATKADKEAAARYGMDLKLYMKNKIKMEKSTGGNAANWASIEV